ncbi:small multi-drug export protein [Candidatus Bipolaricaulota bacterium]|nr:small multi-drug export protein [Candidatus Bipolaricaulota bacterium]
MPWREVLLVLGVSAAPISELRGGIPLALALGFAPEIAFFLALVGNLLPLPLLLFLFPKILRAVEKLPGWLGRAGRAYLAWQDRRKGAFARWGPPALVLFVAIPSPGTGLWTGAVLASLLGIPGRRAGPFLILGVLLAGILVLGASLGLFRLFGI